MTWVCGCIETWPKVCFFWPYKIVLVWKKFNVALFTAAPTGDEPLTPDSAVNVLEEILEAQNQSYVLGLKLKLPLHVADGIYEKYSRPRDRLLQVITAFLHQMDPRPTWRAIIAALRSPVVNLPQLAMRVEAAHFPDPTASRNAPPPEVTTSTGKYNITMTTDCL